VIVNILRIFIQLQNYYFEESELWLTSGGKVSIISHSETGNTFALSDATSEC
jgi:hypothetical protein